MGPDTATGHLDPGTAASYLDQRLSGAHLDAAEAHLASCPSCRAEIVELTGVLRARARPRLVYVGGITAAAAAILLFVAGPQVTRRSPGDTHRDVPTVAPATVELISPKGVANSPGAWRWQPALGADRYELMVFDADGRVVWDTSTTQTMVMAEPSRRLEVGRRYFWRVRARVGWDRWVSSEFAEFTLRAGP